MRLNLKSLNTRSNLYICILILNEPGSSQELGFKWYIEIKVINLMTYFFSNECDFVIRKRKRLTCPKEEILIDEFLKQHDTEAFLKFDSCFSTEFEH